MELSMKWYHWAYIIILCFILIGIEKYNSKITIKVTDLERQQRKLTDSQAIIFSVLSNHEDLINKHIHKRYYIKSKPSTN